MRGIIANLLVKLAIRIDPDHQAKPVGALESMLGSLPIGLHFGEFYVDSKRNLFCVAKGFENSVLLERFRIQMSQERLNEDRLLLEDIFEQSE